MTRCKVLMGTFIEISIGGDGLSQLLAREAIGEAYQAIQLVDFVMNIYQEKSELSRINRFARLGPVKIHPLIKDILCIAKDLYFQTNGLFDCAYNPSHGEPIGSFKDIKWIDVDHIYFQRPIHINLNGLAKGYAVDKAVEVLENYGISSGLVNAGGDLRIFGEDPRPVYIRNPINPLLANAMGYMKNIAIASSGNYLQNHLFNAKRQSTIRTDSSFTVLAKQCVYADGLTKVLASLGHSQHPCFAYYDSLGLVIKG